MALLHLALAAAVGLAGAAARHAQEPAVIEPHGVEIRFVPAVSQGTVSLGVYDAEGRLVRVLADEWTFNRFRIGLNGLSTTWDGRDGSGQPVAPGNYTARGYVVGDVVVRGEAVHFNDWVEGPEAPRIVRVASAQLLPGGDVLLSARLAGASGALVRYSPGSEARWKTVVSEPRPEPAIQAQLAVSDTLAFVLLDGKLRAAQLEDGVELELPVTADGWRAVAARGQRLALLGGEGVQLFNLPDFAPAGETAGAPEGLVSLALLDRGAVGVGEDGSLWRWEPGTGWSELPRPEGVMVRGVSSGRGDTFWALEEQSGGQRLIVQYSADEGPLAEWRAPEGDGVPATVSGAAESDYFVAVLNAPTAQRTVAIRRRADGGWEYVFDKKITHSSEFGWSEGGLVAAGGELPETVTVQVAPNPLDPKAARSMELRALVDTSGTGLAAAEGLPLLRISGDAGYGRVMVVPGDARNTARFFQGDGSCVEEFSLEGLERIFAIDAGEVTMSGGGEEEFLPVIEPEEE